MAELVVIKSAASISPTWPVIQIPFTDFDPGPNVVNRWNVAMAAAQALAATTPFVLVIDGSFNFEQAVTITVRMSMLGALRFSAFTWSVTGNAGMTVATSAESSQFENVRFSGPDPFNGQADVGLHVTAPLCIGTGLVFENWGGIGLYVDGDVTRGSNANEGLWVKCSASLCGNALAHQTGTNAGFYTDGGDSNGNVFVGCDATDCRRGFFDSSFIGNAYVGCSAEGCNDRFVKNPSDPTVGYGYLNNEVSASRLSYYGCYAEGDSECDLNHLATVSGAMPNRGNATIRGGHGVAPYLGAAGPVYYDPFAPGPVNVPNRQVVTTIGGDQDASCLSFTAYQAGGSPVLLPTSLKFGFRAGLVDWWQLNYGNLSAGDLMRFRGNQLWFPNDLRLGATGRRVAWFDTIADAIATGPSDGGAWAPGDRVNINEPASGQPARYCCTAAGSPATFVVESTLA